MQCLSGFRVQCTFPSSFLHFVEPSTFYSGEGEGKDNANYNIIELLMTVVISWAIILLYTVCACPLYMQWPFMGIFSTSIDLY